MSTRPPEATTRRRRPSSRAELLVEVAQELRGYQSALDAFDEAVAASLGVNRTDLRCLDLLSQHQPMTAGALARASGLTTGAVTFVLDRLEDHELVRRRRGPDDRRVVLVDLTPQGAARAFALHAPLVGEFRAAARRFSEADLAMIRDFLSLCRELYERHGPLLRQSLASRRAEGEPGEQRAIIAP